MKIKLNAVPATVSITTPFIRLDSFLKLANVTPSGGEAKLLITGGNVSVNGAVCTMRGKKLYPGDRARVNGKIFEVSSNADHVAEL